MKIALLGDIALVGKYDLASDDAVGRVQSVADELAQYDFVVANLESPMTEIRRSRVPKSLHIRTSPASVELLEALHVNAVTLANNHIHDFGDQGMLDTIDVLERHSIDWYGLNGRSLLREIAGETVSFSGFSCLSANGTGHQRRGTGIGVHLLTAKSVADQVRRDRGHGALSVLSFHWGREHTNYPNLEHLSFARRLARKEQVVVHGHHPHVVQGVEAIGPSLIAYSLGNFIFDDCVSLDGKRVIRNTERNREGLILVVEVKGGRIVGYEAIGVRDVLGGLRTFDISERLDQYSAGLAGVTDRASYSMRRDEEFRSGIAEKRGTRDLTWLIERLNVNSIVSRALGQARAVRYLRVAKALEEFKLL